MHRAGHLFRTFHCATHFCTENVCTKSSSRCDKTIRQFAHLVGFLKRLLRLSAHFFGLLLQGLSIVLESLYSLQRFRREGGKLAGTKVKCLALF
jgi:hypothetical protein